MIPPPPVMTDPTVTVPYSERAPDEKPEEIPLFVGGVVRIENQAYIRRTVRTAIDRRDEGLELRRRIVRSLLVYTLAAVGILLLIPAAVALRDGDMASVLGWLKWVVLLGGFAIANHYAFKREWRAS